MATISGTSGNDTLAGTASQDVIYGGDGDDVASGDSNKDTLYGGAGNDTLDGESSSDVLYGGEGDDVLTGGSGDDAFNVEFRFGNDTITDFEKNRDLIEIRSANVSTFADLQARMTQVGSDTLLSLDDGSTLVLQGVAPGDLDASNFIIGSPVCYATGTLILTDRGAVAVEELCPGDGIVTADNGVQPVVWIGRTAHRFAPGPHKHKPIEIKAGALGRQIPSRTLVVSPQHRMLIAGPVVEQLFEVREVLALAKGLVGLENVRAMNGKRQVTYFSLLCERHEIIQADGAWSETFYPGPTALKMIRPEMRRQIEELFPAVRTDPQTGYGPRARRVLSREETETLAAHLRARGFGALEDEVDRHRRELEHRVWDADLTEERQGRGHLRLVK